MGQINALQESFNAGEFGQRLAGRPQFDKYRNAGITYENLMPLPQGGFTYRPGFRFIANSSSALVRPWLIKFQFSTTQAYMLEFGEQLMRFFRNQAQIDVANTDAAITNGDFPTDLTGWTDQSNGTGAITHDATNLDMDLAANGSGNEAIAEQSITTSFTGVEHVVRFRVTGDPGDSITVRVGSSSGASDDLTDTVRAVGWHCVAFTPSASPFFLQFENGDTKTISVDDISLIDDNPVELTTPWTESDMPDVSFAQSADVVYLARGGTQRVYRLERFGHETWSLVKVLFQDGPFLDQNTTATTLLLSALTGNGITVTASAITGINDDTGFQSTDVGRLIRWEDAANNWTWLQITGVTSTTIVTADVKGPDASATTATADWRLGEWSDARGWPGAVGFIQQRTAWGKTTTTPQKFWLSKTADIENMADEDITGTVLDDSSIVYQFAAREVNTIQWFASRKKPIIGTVGGNWTLFSEGAVLTPTDIRADFEVSGGVSKIPPLEIRNRLLFVHTQGRKLFEFADTLQQNGAIGYDQFDLTLLNDRVLTGGLIQAAYGAEPDSTIWTVREDGQIPTLTYQPEQNVVGWARQIHGGTFEGADAVIESIATIPGQDGTGQFKDSSGRTEVWAAVKMDINGSTVRFIEVLEKMFNLDEDLQEEAFYVDSGLTLDVPLTMTAATVADPVEITLDDASSLTDGDEVRIVRVRGMTEINAPGDPEGDGAGTYNVFEATGTTIEIADVDGKALTAATKANPGQLTIPDHDFSNSDEIAVFDVLGMTELNGVGFTVTVVDTDNITIGVDTSSFTTYTSGGTANPAIDGTAFTAYASGGEVRKKELTITGLDHLEAAEVKVFADGAVQSEKTVSSGSITLDEAASVVHVGLNIEYEWESLKLAFGARGGTAVGRPKNISDLILVLMETAEGSLRVATRDSDGLGVFSDLDLRSALQIGGFPVPFFTGEVNLGINAPYDTDLRLVIRGNSPAPATILALAPQIETTG